MTSKIHVVDKAFTRVRFSPYATLKNDTALKAELITSLADNKSGEYKDKRIKASMVIKGNKSNRKILEAQVIILINVDAKTAEKARGIAEKYAEEIGYTEIYNMVKSLHPTKFLGPYKTVKFTR